MTKDNPPIFSNRRTLHERRQLRKRMVAHVLKSKFKKEFKTRRTLVGNQMFTVDLMSEDGEIAAKLIHPCIRSSQKICPGKFQQILSATLVLRSIDSKRKLLIFTNKKMYQNFFNNVKSMPSPICDTVKGIEIAWIPLADEFDNFEYSEPPTNLRINQDNLRQTRRDQE